MQKIILEFKIDMHIIAYILLMNKIQGKYYSLYIYSVLVSVDLKWT